MIRKPAHKNTDNPPGQSINNPGHTINREKELNKPWPEKRLSDIIRNTHERDARDNQKKLTFEEWFVDTYGQANNTQADWDFKEEILAAWEAGQRNK